MQSPIENCRANKTPKLIVQGAHHPVTKIRQRCHTKKKKTAGQNH